MAGQDGLDRACGGPGSDRGFLLTHSPPALCSQGLPLPSAPRAPALGLLPAEAWCGAAERSPPQGALKGTGFCVPWSHGWQGPHCTQPPRHREAGVLMSPTWRAELWLLGLLAALAGEVRFPCSLVIPLPRSPQGQHIHEIPVGPLQRLGTAQPLGRPALRRAPFPPSGGSYQGPLAGGTVRGTPAPLLSPAVVLSSCWRSRALPHFQQVGARGALPQPEGGRSDRGCAWVGAGGGDPTLAGVPGS